MKVAGVLLVAGFALSAIGAALLFVSGDFEVNGDGTLVVQEGADSFAYLEVDMGGGGPIEGTFTSVDDTPVRFSVMDEGQFADFQAGTSDDSRVSTLAASGEFSIEQVDMTVCYILVRHSYGTTSPQTVEVEYTVTNTDWVVYAIWVAMMSVGGAAVFLAFHLRKKERSGMRVVVSDFKDVVFFDEQ